MFLRKENLVGPTALKTVYCNTRNEETEREGGEDDVLGEGEEMAGEVRVGLGISGGDSGGIVLGVLVLLFFLECEFGLFKSFLLQKR